ncbi:lipopolysaccharide transport periplasmic protein LptA [Brucella suis 63/252]|uniref:LPS ABC transporter substrate-binding protein LptA n=1 Tax=Brucella TaxID=234 RepID=UPI0002CEB09F|nr:LPS ABC transporter substrate-binding protein LptA [Brucella suis]ENR17723.1 lipopolysaccharide transport periplasmic protein LptA [Brucella suis 63/252]KEY00683.1 organic solvent tolerance protein OstA [Brucella inopinata BO1]
MERETGKMNGDTMVRTLRIGFSVLALAAFAAPGASWAQQAGDGSVPGLKLSNSKDPVKIDADKLEMRDKEGVAVFTGNVAVSQGDALLKAGQMTVYYSKAKKGAEAPEPANAGVGGIGSSSIDHIDIAGKVYLKSGTQVATGDTGRYDAKNQIMVLQGQKVVLTDGDNIVTGCKLIAHLDTGRANVESCKGQTKGRVSIIMAPKDQQQGGAAPKRN